MTDSANSDKAKGEGTECAVVDEVRFIFYQLIGITDRLFNLFAKLL